MPATEVNKSQVSIICNINRLNTACITWLFAYCKGGNFNIHTGCGSAISSAKEGKSGFIYILVKS